MSTAYFIAAAKRVLSRKLPGLAGFIETLPCVPSEDCPGVAASARGVIYVNPRMAEEDPLLLPYCLLREAAQILLNHAERRKKANVPADVWREAARMSLYCLLWNARTLPTYDMLHRVGLISPSQYNLDYNHPTEYYANELMEWIRRKPDIDASSGDSGEGEVGVPSGDSGEDEKRTDEERQGVPSGEHKTDESKSEPPKLDSTQSGSAEDGERRPWESEDVDRRAALPTYVKQIKIEEAISGLRGIIGADLDRFIGRFSDRSQGAVRLLQLIRPSAEFGRSVHSDFNYDRPSRRSQCSNVVPRIILPRLEGRSYEAAILVDTSGSIYDDELKRVAKLICAVNSLRSGKFHLFSGDTEIKTSLVLQKGSEALRFSGGGGTEVGQMMLAVAKKIAKRPLQLLVFTDAETPWIAKEEVPGVDVTAILVRKYHPPVPAWIKVRYLDEFWPE